MSTTGRARIETITKELEEKLKTASFNEYYQGLLTDIKTGSDYNNGVQMIVENVPHHTPPQFDNDKKALTFWSSIIVSHEGIGFMELISLEVNNPTLIEIENMNELIPLLFSMSINGRYTPVSAVERLAVLLKN